MRFFLLVAAVLFTADAARPKAIRKGLSDRGDVAVEDLLRLRNDAERFAKHLETITANPNFETVLVLTHSMFELPWDGGQEGRDNPSSIPKLLVESHLDRLVAVQRHDSLSAGYFRALKRKQGVEEAKAALLDWTVEQRARLVLKDGRFVSEE